MISDTIAYGSSNPYFLREMLGQIREMLAAESCVLNSHWLN